MPAALLRVAIETNMASAVKPHNGGSTETHARRRAANAVGRPEQQPGQIDERLRADHQQRRRRCCSPPSTVSAATERSERRDHFSGEHLARLRERVSTVFQVP